MVGSLPAQCSPCKRVSSLQAGGVQAACRVTCECCQQPEEGGVGVRLIEEDSGAPWVPSQLSVKELRFKPGAKRWNLGLCPGDRVHIEGERVALKRWPGASWSFRQRFSFNPSWAKSVPLRPGSPVLSSSPLSLDSGSISGSDFTWPGPFCANCKALFFVIIIFFFFLESKIS